MMALRKEGSEVWSTDVAVPLSILGHIGDGNFHASIMYDRQDPAERARVEKVVYDMVDRALEMEGSCTV
jgi:D-lactate dehydrogenase (cytochrome)